MFSSLCISTSVESSGLVHMAESNVVERLSNGQDYSDLPPLNRWISFIQQLIFNVICTLYSGIDKKMHSMSRYCPLVAKSELVAIANQVEI